MSVALCRFCAAPTKPGAPCQNCGRQIGADDLRATLLEVPAPPVHSPQQNQVAAKPPAAVKPSPLQTPPSRPRSVDNQPGFVSPTPAKAIEGEKQRRQENASIQQDTPLYRPQIRSVTALLLILDDGSTRDGEIVRVRQSELVIGRGKDTNVRIEHDGRISSRHALLKPEMSLGRARWILQDLNSRNGTYARVSRAVLSNNSEFMIGGTCLKFIIENCNEEASVDDLQATQMLRRSSNDSPAVYLHSLEDPNRKLALQQGVNRIGRSPSNDVAFEQDQFICPVHVKISFLNGAWILEDNSSVNGTWMRVEQVTVDREIEFQLGEQRFRFITNPKSSSKNTMA